MKIIQIIPAPQNMLAHFEFIKPDTQCDKKIRTVAENIPVCCLALVEYESGEREVQPMIATSDEISFPFDSSNFLFITND